MEEHGIEDGAHAGVLAHARSHGRGEADNPFGVVEALLDGFQRPGIGADLQGFHGLGARGQVAGGGPEGEGGHDRRPVEQLPARGDDAVDGQGPLDPVPDQEDHGQHHGEEGGGGRVGYVELLVKDISSHSADDGHH